MAWFLGFAGYRPNWIGPDLLAGLTLAAIAIPEQMATARLAGLPPNLGLIAFIAGAVGFAIFGAGRRLSVGADSTITAIFAGALTLLAAGGSPHYAALAVVLALIVGALVTTAGILKLGWIGNLLSIPVTTGFLLGIAAHIAVSQLPAALGVGSPGGDLPEQLLALASRAREVRLPALAVACGVLIVTDLGHRLSPRLPAALLAVGVAAVAARVFGLAPDGLAPDGLAQGSLAVVGSIAGRWPALGLPHIAAADLAALAPLALILTLVIIAQTSATARAFPDDTEAPDIDRDLVGVGVGGLIAGMINAFPVNVSPPRTAVVADAGGRSPLAGLAAAGVVAGVLAWGGGLLATIPQAALAGLMLFVATRLVRLNDILAVCRASRAEGGLILATAAAMVVLPIASGVAVGVTLSLLHGAWSNARVRVTRLRRIPGSTVWWPPIPGRATWGESVPGVAVLGFSAPLIFLNADAFARTFLGEALYSAAPSKLVVLEAAGLVELDYTGAQALRRVVLGCRAAGASFAVARLESPAAQAAFTRFGLWDLICEDHVFETVARAIDALAPVVKA